MRFHDNEPFRQLFGEDADRLGLEEGLGLKTYNTPWTVLTNTVGNSTEITFEQIITDPFVAIGMRVRQITPIGQSYPFDYVRRFRMALDANGQSIIGGDGAPAILFAGSNNFGHPYAQLGPMLFYGDSRGSDDPTDPVFTFYRAMAGDSDVYVKVSVLGFHAPEKWLAKQGYYDRRIVPFRNLAGFNADVMGLPKAASLRYIRGGPVDLDPAVGDTATIDWNAKHSKGFKIFGLFGYQYDPTGVLPFEWLRQADFKLYNNKQPIIEDEPSDELFGNYQWHHTLPTVGPFVGDGNSEYSPYIVHTRRQAPNPAVAEQVCTDLIGYYPKPEMGAK